MHDVHRIHWEAATGTVLTHSRFILGEVFADDLARASCCSKRRNLQTGALAEPVSATEDFSATA